MKEQSQNDKLGANETTNKTVPKVTFNNFTAKTNTRVVLTAQLPSDATGLAGFKINSRTLVNTLKPTSGVVSYTYNIPEYTAKEYTLTFMYSGSSKYNATKVNSTLTLTKLESKASINNYTSSPGKSVQIFTRVTNELGNAVVNAPFVIKLNGITVANNRTTNAGYGIINYTIPTNFVDKQYNLQLVVGENSVNKKVVNSSKLNLSNPTIMSLSAIRTKPLSTAMFNATIKDSNNKTINSGKMSFSFNNSIVGYGNVKNGVATYNFSVPLIEYKTYQLAASYIPDSKYNYENKTFYTYMLVTRLDTKTNSTNTSLQAGASKNITITVKDENNKNVRNGNLTVYVGGSAYKVLTVNNGVAKFTYTAPYNQSGSQVTFIAYYNGTNSYSTSSFSGSINITAPKTVYVSPNGKDTNNGNNTSPLKTIKQALTRIANNGTIYLKNGQYNESNLQINKTIHMSGLSKADSIIISGLNKTGSLINLTSNNSVLYLNNVTLRNAYNTKAKQAAITSKGYLFLTGCKIIDNKATASDSSAGIYSTGYLSVSTTQFRNNVATNTEGAAITISNERYIIRSSNFTSNKVTGNNLGGGAIYAYNATGTVTGSRFIDNHAYGANGSGGAIRTALGSLGMNQTRLENNSVNGSGVLSGGAIGDTSTAFNVSNSQFIRNAVSGTGTSIGGAIQAQNIILRATNLIFNNNLVKGVTASGGAMYNYNVYSAITNTNFTSNNATSGSGEGNAGAVRFQGGTLTASEIRFTNNQAKGKSAYGGALFFGGSVIKLSKSAFTNNMANATTSASAGSVYTSGNASYVNVNFTSNKALAKSNGGGAITNTGNLTAHYCNFQSNAASSGGTAIFNAGKVVSINYNYWGAASPTWSKLLYNATNPNIVSKSLVK